MKDNEYLNVVLLVQMPKCVQSEHSRSLLRTAACVFGNSLEDFTSAGDIGEVQVLVLAVFAGGNPAVIGELWPQVKAGTIAKHLGTKVCHEKTLGLMVFMMWYVIHMSYTVLNRNCSIMFFLHLIINV